MSFVLGMRRLWRNTRKKLTQSVWFCWKMYNAEADKH